MDFRRSRPLSPRRRTQTRARAPRARPVGRTLRRAVRTARVGLRDAGDVAAGHRVTCSCGTADSWRLAAATRGRAGSLTGQEPTARELTVTVREPGTELLGGQQPRAPPKMPPRESPRQGLPVKTRRPPGWALALAGRLHPEAPARAGRGRPSHRRRRPMWTGASTQHPSLCEAKTPPHPAGSFPDPYLNTPEGQRATGTDQAAFHRRVSGTRCRFWSGDAFTQERFDTAQDPVSSPAGDRYTA